MKSNSPSEIAVVGVACRFPGAPDVDTFWNNLIRQENHVTEIPPSRWDWRTLADGDNGIGEMARWGAFLDDIDRFDAAFFGVSPHEARCLDPQQRLLLEQVWCCIENAGYDPRRLAGSRTALFAGVTTSDYHSLVATSGAPVDGYTVPGLSPAMLANRVSYLLGFTGPSEPVDTACSSALVALQHAVMAIEAGQCEQALVGGVNLLLSPTLYQSFGRAGMLSVRGACAAFDAAADGYVRGEGCAVVLLKPLARAVADGDTVWGVVRGVAVNHGGRVRSLTTPSAYAQSRVIIEAMTQAGVAPGACSYIEAHGTGTPLGDPIEMLGLKRAFSRLGRSGDAAGATVPRCGIGSVKANIGHLEAAAGMAGLIKVLLCLRHRLLPGQRGFSTLSPHIDLADSPFYVVQQNQPWQPQCAPDGSPLPLRAGVSAFGFGGVNAYAVLEEFAGAGQAQPASAEQGHLSRLLLLSARDGAALQRRVLQLAQTLRTQDAARDLARTAYTLQLSRAGLPVRLAVWVQDVDDACRQLEHWHPAVTLNTAELPAALVQPVQDWLAGATVDWAAFYSRPLQKMPLPAYPFAGEHYWVETVTPPPVTSTPAPVQDGKFDLATLERIWQEEVPDLPFDPDADLLDLDSITLLALRQQLRRRTGVDIDNLGLDDRLARPRQLVEFIQTTAPARVATPSPQQDVRTTDFQRLAGLYPDSIHPQRWFAAAEKNPLPVIFVISSLCHGASLFGSMLNGHPQLYAAPGLRLLPFTHLRERDEALRQQRLYADDGLVSAVQDLWQLDNAGAIAQVRQWKALQMPIQQVYRLLQEKCYPRILVDLGTTYALHDAVLERTRDLFADARFIHLLRHPYSVLASGKAWLKQTAFQRDAQRSADTHSDWLDLKLHELVDTLWHRTHQTVRAFHQRHPALAVHELRFEELQTDSEAALRRVCQVLELPFDARMLQPGEDFRCAQSDAADRSGVALPVLSHAVSTTTRRLAQSLGYACPLTDERQRFVAEVFVPLNGIGGGVPLLVLSGTGGALQPFVPLVQSLNQPAFGLALTPEVPIHSIESACAFYLQQLDELPPVCSLLGYSSGAVLAWELARQLQQRGSGIQRVVLLDRDPSLPQAWLSLQGLPEDALRRLYEHERRDRVLALGLFAYTRLGVVHRQLPALILQLLAIADAAAASQQDREAELLRQQGGGNIQPDEVEDFCFYVAHWRELMEAYPAQSLQTCRWDPVLIAAEAAGLMSDVGHAHLQRVVLPDCDHFSLLRHPELPALLRSLLTGDDALARDAVTRLAN